MDSRAGAISEATDAGADLEHVRHAATHSDISMTQRYSRNSVEKVANVQHKRASHRNKSGT
jgi:site-specific recombinase XerD